MSICPDPGAAVVTIIQIPGPSRDASKNQETAYIQHL